MSNQSKHTLFNFFPLFACFSLAGKMKATNLATSTSLLVGFSVCLVWLSSKKIGRENTINETANSS